MAQSPWDRLNHWIALNETRRIIERAVAAQSRVTLDRWINEWEVVEPSVGDSKTFYLHTVLSESPPLSCSPDAGMLLSVGSAKKVFYIERDLGTSSPKQIAARKTRGYAEMSRREAHRLHFPETTLPNFSVLMVTTNKYRVEQIGKQLQKKESPGLWLLVDEHDLTPETFLHGRIVHDVNGVAGPLIQGGGAS